MNQSLYGFHYDFVRHRGTCLVLSGTKPLSFGQLERIELRMLEGDAIPGLLPFEAEEIDLNVRLRYDITGKRMLSQWMKTGKLTLASYYRLLLGCAGTIDDSQTYMLREDGYWLHDEFIFVGSDNDIAGDLSLLYVPVRDADNKPPVRVQFKELALRLSACIERIEGGGFTALMAALNRDRFEFRDIRSLLAGLLDPEASRESARYASGFEPEPVAATPAPPQREHEPSPFSAVSQRLSSSSRNEPADSPRPFSALPVSGSEEEARPVLPSWISSAKPLHSRMRSPDEEPGPEPWSGEGSTPAEVSAATAATPRTRKQAALGAGAAAALVLLIWSFYPPDAAEGFLSIWSGLTVLLLDALFVWLRLGPSLPLPSGLESLARSYKEMEEREMTGLTGLLSARPSVQPSAQPSAVAPAPRADRPKPWLPAGQEPALRRPEGQESVLPQPVESYGAASTTLLRQPDATVLLRPGTSRLSGQAEDGADGKRPPVLEVAKSGKAERLPLAGERFLIGRERDAVDYVEEAAGVSKLHLEIAREQSDYFAKDLGSKNGTLWNNEPMVPYKRYPLANGDTLQVIGTRFTFRLPESD
ncbi:DUF6382 domain-containing protein [Paenibacillus hodogayensis]|uniref:DUF6382 domain-containing protein n=1 Tax=Paenibacillus hodogayensis TaxID=279208 RepID=A0ABV5W3Y2_9BACL